MHAIRERNIDRVDPRLVQQLVVGSVRVRNVVLLRVFLGLLQGTGGDGGDDDAPVALCGVDERGRVDRRGGEDANAKGVGLLWCGVARAVEVLGDESGHLCGCMRSC